MKYKRQIKNVTFRFAPFDWRIGIAIQYLILFKSNFHGGMPIKDWFDKGPCAAEIVINLPMVNVTIYKDFRRLKKRNLNAKG